MTRRALRVRLAGLARARDGVSVVEFALLAPVLLLILLGMFDMGFNIYAQTMLQGALQQAARGSSIQAASTATIDAAVTSTVKGVIPSAVLTFNRTSYTNFGDVATPEDFTDTNGDGTCDNGESYEDANNNGTWDRDRGTTGAGGARDAVLYTVTMSFPRIMPMSAFSKLSQTVTVTARTVLRNQPYQLQQVNVPTVRTCP